MAGVLSTWFKMIKPSNKPLWQSTPLPAHSPCPSHRGGGMRGGVESVDPPRAGLGRGSALGRRSDQTEYHCLDLV
jgi:hypothetical protein